VTEAFQRAAPTPVPAFRPPRRPSALFAFTSSARMQIRIGLAHSMTYAAGTLNATMFLGILVLSRSTPPDTATATSMVTGSALAAFWASCVWGGVAVLRRERQMRVFGRSLTGVQDPLVVLTGKIAGYSLLNLAVVLLSLVGGCLLFGLRPAFANPLAAVLGFAFVLASGTAASLLVGGVLVVSRHSLAISSAIGMPVTLLGGTILPLTVFPEPVRWVSHAISLSWLQEFLSSTASGSPEWPALGWATVLSAVYAVVGIRIFSRMLDRARNEATLDIA
jgi:ABC-type multidrug transport system permease subunit